MKSHYDMTVNSVYFLYNKLYSNTPFYNFFQTGEKFSFSYRGCLFLFMVNNHWYDLYSAFLSTSWNEKKKEKDKQVVAGVGEEPAAEFWAYCSFWRSVEGMR